MKDDETTGPVSATAAGDPYCGHCGYSLRGLQNSSKCPECGGAIVDVLMRRGFPARKGKRYRSRSTLFGLPMIDVAFGPSGSVRIGRARGVIAIGDFAVGGIAIGGSAVGVVAVGGGAVGVFSIGGCAIGLLSALGGAAVSFGIAVGGAAVGAIASGGGAVGLIAQGGLAVGMYARGATVIGGRSGRVFRRLHWLLGSYPPRPLDACRPLILVGVMLIAAGLIGLAAMAGSKVIKEDGGITTRPL